MKLTLKRSLIGVRKKHRDTVKALGLRKTGDQREVHETPAIKGMVTQVAYLLEIEGAS